MNGFIRTGLLSKGLFLLCAGAPLAVMGCYEYRDLVDPCYPQRYNYMAKNEVRGAFNTQMAHGHMLDQTVFSHYFEAGTDKLNGMGLDRLAILARQTPEPDTMLFLQTSQLGGDLAYDPANPDKLRDARQELDAKRILAVQRFMLAQTNGAHNFQVAVVDPSEVGLPAAAVASATIQLVQTHFQGNLTKTGVGGVVGGGAGGANANGGGINK